LRADPDTEDLPVILITAIPAIDGEQEGFKLGVKHYIPKPFKSKTVNLTVKVALREAESDGEDQAKGNSVWSGSSSYRRTAQGVGSLELIRTGDALSLLEQKLGGGLLKGSLTLVEGETATGKSVLCQHLAHGSLMDRHPVAYFTSESTARGLSKQMQSIGLTITSFLRDEDLCVYPLEDPDPTEDSGPLLAALALDIGRLPKKYDLIIVDSVTLLATYSLPQHVVTFFSSLRRLCGKERTVVVVAHSYGFDPTMLTRISSLCDSHLSLRTGKIRSKVLFMAKLLKVNNVHLESDNLINFEVEPGTGIRIVPFSQARV